MPPTPTAPPSRIGTVKRILFSLLVTVVVLGTAEIVLRVVLPAPAYLELRVYPNLPGDLAPSEEAPITLREGTRNDPATASDPAGRSFTMTSTPEGFRSPSRRSDDSRFRILCLGDSSMMGYLVPDWETFPAQLAARLEDSTGPWVEVLNAAAIGYTIDDELDYMKAKGLALRPNIVVLEIFANDVIEKDIRPRRTLREASRVRWPFSAFGPAIDQWGLVRAGRLLATRLLPPPVAAEPVERVRDILEPGRAPAMFDAYEKTFREFAALLDQHQIRLVVLLTPHHFQVCPWGDYTNSDVYQGRMRRMGEGTDAAWIDMLPAFRRAIVDQPDLYITNGLYDLHETGAGQRVKLDAAWPALVDAMRKDGAVDLGRRWADAPAGPRWQFVPSFRWGRTWTGNRDAPGIEVRPPAKTRLDPLDAPPNDEFRCELVGGPYADQCRLWISVDDGATTRVADVPVVGPGEVRPFSITLTREKAGTVQLDFLAAWAEGFHPEERTDLQHAPLVLRRPVLLPAAKKEAQREPAASRPTEGSPGS